MSKTIRKEDPYNNSKKLSKKEKWKATRDRKPWYKPSKDFKETNRHRERAETNGAIRNAVANNKDFDEIIIPDAKRHDEWDWN